MWLRYKEFMVDWGDLNPCQSGDVTRISSFFFQLGSRILLWESSETGESKTILLKTPRLTLDFCREYSSFIAFALLIIRGKRYLRWHLIE